MPAWDSVKAYYTTEVQLGPEFQLNSLANRSLWYLQVFCGRESVAEQNGKFVLVEKLDKTTPSALRITGYFLAAIVLFLPGTFFRLLSLDEKKVFEAVFGNRSVQPTPPPTSPAPARKFPSPAKGILRRDEGHSRQSSSTPKKVYFKEQDSDKQIVQTPPPSIAPAVQVVREGPTKELLTEIDEAIVFLETMQTKKTKEELEPWLKAEQEKSGCKHPLMLSQPIQAALRDHPQKMAAIIPADLFQRWQALYTPCHQRLEQFGLKEFERSVDFADPIYAQQIKDDVVKAKTFYLNVVKNKEQAQLWDANAELPFFYTLYWLSNTQIRTVIGTNDVKLLEMFFQRVVTLLHSKGQQDCLLQKPPEVSPGLYTLVHVLTDHLRMPEVPPAVALDPKYQPLVNEIEAALKNPGEASSQTLSNHLHLYLKRYAGKIETIVPAELLTRWRASSIKNEEIKLPVEVILQGCIEFLDCMIGQTKNGNESAKLWLQEKKTLQFYPNPFFTALYLSTIANKEGKLVQIADSYQQVVTWAHRTKQAELLLEVPAGFSPGLIQLVHFLTEDLRARPAAPAASPSLKAPKAEKPDLKVSPHRMEVDDKVFREAVIKAAPRFQNLLGNPRTFPYWKGVILDRIESQWKSCIEIYQELQKRTTKIEVLHYLNAVKLVGEKPAMISRDLVEMTDHLAPLIPQGVAKLWKKEYDQCCQHVRNFKIQDSEYIEVKIGFFEIDVIMQKFLEDKIKKMIQFFENLKKVSKDITGWVKKEETTHQITPFWFAENLDELIKGHDLKLKEKDVQKLKKLYQEAQQRLTQLKMTDLLNEPIPVPDRKDLCAMLDRF